ncbi:MAG: hypothetical protein OXI91_14870 [Chloroflexota bacterium]|nr:hypothetical protein [Chloroflexota bacterium]
MAWPQPVDFSRALRNPDRCFEAPDLAQGAIFPGPDGAPLVHSGDSACVFKLATAERDVAVRCFTRQVTGLQARYASLDDHLRAGGSDSLVGFEYLEQGIRVEGDWFPIVRMDWAEGSRLDGFVEEHIAEPDFLLDVAARWRSAVTSIRGLGIAHNDLEHGNIIVLEDGSLRLVDYDGMFVPGFEGQESPEPGHRNYRHPIRDTRNYDANIDNFPSLVIYLSLLAVAADPNLWKTFHREDNLILTRQDFTNPPRSRCLEALRSSPDPVVAALAERLQHYCTLPVNQVPDLENVIRDLPEAPQPSMVLANKPPSSPVSAPSATTAAAAGSGPLAAPTPPSPPSPQTAAGPVAATANGDGFSLSRLLMSGRLLLGLLGAALVFFLLGFFLKPAESLFVVSLAAAFTLLSVQARYSTRVAVAPLMGTGAAIYLYGAFWGPDHSNTHENAAALFFGLALILVGIPMASRLLRYTRSPEPATGVSRFFDELGDYNQVGISLFVIGVVTFLVGLMPQETLDSLLDGGVDYQRAGGINASAEALFWPMMALDKVQFLGALSLWVGVAMLLFGSPRALLFLMIRKRGAALFAADRRKEAEERIKRAVMSDAERRKDFKERLARVGRGREDAEEEPNPVEEAATIQFALGLMVIGLLVFLVASEVVEGFLFPTALEIGAAVTRNYDVLYTHWGDLPWWIKFPNAFLKYGGAIAGILGFVFFIVSLRSVRKIGRGIDAFLDKLDEIIPPTPIARDSPPTPGGTPERPTAHGGMLQANRRGRGR